MSAGQEIELKLEVPDGATSALGLLPLLKGLTSKTRQQRSVYYDTADRALRDLGLSLRIRHDGERKVRTVKTDAPDTAGLFARDEWESEVHGNDTDLKGAPAALAKMLKRRRLDTLNPAFTAEVTRQTWMIGTDEADIELVLDEGSLSASDRQVKICEIELELKRGEPEALFRIARVIAESVPVRIGVLTKSERGYRLLDKMPDRADKAGSIALTKNMSVAAAFQAIARSCLRHYRINEDRLLADGNPDALHQARVALRRLRSALSVFKPVLQDRRFERFRAEFKWLAAQLGQVRDLDVLIKRAGDAPVGQVLQGHRDEALEELRGVLASARARRLLLDFSEWLAFGDWHGPEGVPLREETIDLFASHLLSRYRRRLKRAGADLASIDEEARHQVRIIGKKLRYAVDFFGALYGRPQDRKRRKAFLKALEQLQSHLGDLNDHATGREVLDRLGVPADEAAGILDRHIDRSALIDAAARSYADLMDAGRFWPKPA